jgi:phospholipid-binding lipoprotein MlaA
MSVVDFSVRYRIGFLCVFFALAGCAGQSRLSAEKSPADPWESMNRPSFDFNEGLDQAIIKPVAKGYEAVVPKPMRQGVTNFSRNLRTPLNGINNLLQGKGLAAANDLARFVVNSTFGILGIFDVATANGVPMSEEDFGQTFAVWGVPDGPYIMVPLLGPRTLRDTFAIPLNFLADPLFHYNNKPVRRAIYAVRLIDVRQRLFKAEELLKGSQDRYISLREAYLQRRQYLIHDGNPPVDEAFFDEFLEEEDY